MIKITCIGHLGKDCNVNNVNGKNVINFSVAHSEKFKNAQGVEVNKTTWVNCAFWVDRTTLAQYLLKGTQVYVEGQPEVSSYKAQDGQWKSELRCRVSIVQLLGGKRESDGHSNSAPATVSNPHSDISQEDFSDLPF